MHPFKQSHCNFNIIWAICISSRLINQGETKYLYIFYIFNIYIYIYFKRRYYIPRSSALPLWAIGAPHAPPRKFHCAQQCYGSAHQAAGSSWRLPFPLAFAFGFGGSLDFKAGQRTCCKGEQPSCGYAWAT